MNRILILVDHKRNQQLLVEWLSQRYTVVQPDAEDSLGSRFDLVILDGTALDRHWEAIATKKAAEQPLFLPILFITTRQDIGMVTRHLWKSIDEIILSPIEKIELVARVEVLLSARRLSTELESANEQLWQKISEQQQTEAALLRSNHRFERATQMVNGIIYDWNIPTDVVEKSSDFEGILGYKHAGDSYTRAWWNSKISPHDLGYMLAQVESALLRDSNFSLEYEIVNASGDYRCLWDKGSIIRDEQGHATSVIGFILDITERKQAEKERAELLLQERAARVEAERVVTRLTRLQTTSAALATALTPDQAARIAIERSIATFEAEAGLLLLTNEENKWLKIAFAQGFSPIDLQDLYAYFDGNPSALNEIIDIREPYWFRSTTTSQQENKTFANVIPVLNSALLLPLLIEDRTIGFVWLLFLEQKEFDQEVSSLGIMLTQQIAQVLERTRLYEMERLARADAEKANEAKIKFLGIISHELRTPLTSIKGFSSTLLTSDVKLSPERQQQFIGIIDDEADKMRELTEQLLQLSTLQAGALPIQLQLGQVNDAISAYHVQLNALAINHKLALDLSTDLPFVMLDTIRIGQVLTNLVGNAVKFSPPQSEIILTTRVHNEYVHVDVSDKGSGISPEDREVIFEAFRQLESRPTKGVGLGLAICKGIINSHQGEIWVAENQLPGTTISFTLPIAREIN